MRLYEHEGKALFEKYGIPIPKGFLATGAGDLPVSLGSVAVKAQVRFGDRKNVGGIAFANSRGGAVKHLGKLLGKKIRGEVVERALIEERIKPAKEYYVSISYDSGHRGPVLALSSKGGTGVAGARIFPIDIALGLPQFFMRSALGSSGFLFGGVTSEIAVVVQRLWELFLKEHCLLAEINPLFITKVNTCVAGDAKIILDDEKLKPGERRFLELPGDIAILASGGGASLLNIDTLMRAGGKPANYTEYSGNPPSRVVKELTLRVLNRSGLKGCWVIGGTANFTDIYETLTGFVDGLAELPEKPKYPIVIRRDGPRQAEAFAMLRDVAQKHGYRFHLYDSKTAMAETARIMVELAYDKRIRNKEL